MGEGVVRELVQLVRTIFFSLQLPINLSIQCESFNCKCISEQHVVGDSRFETPSHKCENQ